MSNQEDLHKNQDPGDATDPLVSSRFQEDSMDSNSNTAGKNINVFL